MKRWDYVENKGIKIITIEEWMNQGVILAFSTRWGGTSGNDYASLNMGLHVGDEENLVLENRRRFLQSVDVNLDDVVCCEQIHGTKMIRVDTRHKGKGARLLSDSIEKCDAMICNTPGVYLMTFYADCIPLYFYDEVHRAVGIAHSGWKGTMDKIAVKTIDAMKKEFGSTNEELRVFIGPGIGSCCFEIQADLANRVNNEFYNFSDIIYTSPDQIFKWDLQETNRQILVNSGVNPINITLCKLCTACHPEIFYSYRKDKGHTGRMSALIGLKY